MIERNLISVAQSHEANYPSSPYSPSSRYPEYPFDDVASGRPFNHVYDLVRTVLMRLGLDREHSGTADWNPLGELVRPGNTVVVKPNWVYHKNRGPGTFDSVTTHPSVVRALVDYIWIALHGEGTVVVGDAPIQGCDLEKLWEQHQWHSIPAYYQAIGNLRVVLEDWRIVSRTTSSSTIVFRSETRRSDESWLTVDLGTQSALEPVSTDYRSFFVGDYDSKHLHAHHSPGKHEYCVSRRVLESDVVFNVAKLKTHRLAGFTCCLKSMVGINGHKSYLPHFRRGAATHGHDEYPTPHALKALQTWISERHGVSESWVHQAVLGSLRFGLLMLIRLFDGFHQGAWYGNDTIWRTIMDLNRVAVYADREGVVQTSPQRQIFCLVDGIVAGEGQGPMKPKDRHCGVILAGVDPFHVDTAAVKLIGLREDLVSLLNQEVRARFCPASKDTEGELHIVGDNREPLRDWIPGIEPFLPSSGWASLSVRAPR